MEILLRSAREIFAFFQAVSPSLLLGFFIAGLLHVLFPEHIVRRHLGKNSVGSVIKATLFAIPLSLCSCGVVPVAAGMRKQGASKGATAAFLIATPEIGADSYLVTYSFLGNIFALFRVVAALLTALTAGLWINWKEKAEITDTPSENAPAPSRDGAGGRLKRLFHYIQFELLGSIANSLVAGIILAGLISAWVPGDFFQNHLTNPFLSMLVMMAAGIPLYICATASTPIAAALVFKGLAPGAALVFLLTGPATNALTMAMVYQRLGRRPTAIYLASVAGVGLAMGSLLNLWNPDFSQTASAAQHHHPALGAGGWLQTAATLLMFLLLARFYLKNFFQGKKQLPVSPNHWVIPVEGMTCGHCVARVHQAVASVKGTSHIYVDLKNHRVAFQADDPAGVGKIKAAISSAGYQV